MENYEVILQNHELYVYPRLEDDTKNNDDIELKSHPKVHIINAPVVEISSTFIRTNIKTKKMYVPFCLQKYGNTLIIIILQK